jgi:hypothetical protein
VAEKVIIINKRDKNRDNKAASRPGAFTGVERVVSLSKRIGKGTGVWKFEVTNCDLKFIPMGREAIQTHGL